MKRGTVGIICLECGKYGIHECLNDPTEAKRDYFAAAALAAGNDPAEAYRLADAMMLARQPAELPKAVGKK